jgi:hypothetical protein
MAGMVKSGMSLFVPIRRITTIEDILRLLIHSKQAPTNKESTMRFTVDDIAIPDSKLAREIT